MRYRQRKLFIPKEVQEEVCKSVKLYNFHTVAFRKNKFGTVQEHIDLIKYVIKDALETDKSNGSIKFIWATDIPNIETGLIVPNAYHIGFVRELDLYEELFIESMFEKYRKTLKLGTKKVFLKKGIFNGSVYMLKQSGQFGEAKVGIRKRDKENIRKISCKYNKQDYQRLAQ